MPTAHEPFCEFDLSRMRRLEEWQEPEPTLQDLDDAIYGPDAARWLVDEVSRPSNTPLRPDGGMDHFRQMLFEGANSLTPNEALARGSSALGGSYGARMHSAWVLRHAMHFGIVALEDGSEGPRFVAVHPGIVHFPRLGSVANSRNVLVGGRGMSLRGLLKREGNRRAKKLAEQRQNLVDALAPLVRSVEPSVEVPAYLASTDHPPAENMGDFVRELEGFLEMMPTWRIGELIMVFGHMPKRQMLPSSLESAEEACSDPEELRDFSL